MRNPFSSLLPSQGALRIGLATDGISVLKTRGLLHPQTSLLADCALTAEQSAAPQGIADQLRRLLTDANCTNHPTSIVVDDQWVRLFMVTPPQNTGSLEDCKASAAMRFHELYGESMTSWQLSADWQVNHPFLACAMPLALVTSLQKTTKDLHLPLLSIVPQFIAAWNQWRSDLKEGAWFGLVQGNTLTLAAIGQQRVRAVHSATVTDEEWQDAQWLPAHLERSAMLLNLPTPALLQLCGPIPHQSNAKVAISPICVRLDAAQQSMERGAISAAAQLAQTGVRTGVRA